jgi:archaemetzincin
MRHSNIFFFIVLIGILIATCSKPYKNSEKLIGIQVYRGFDTTLLDSIRSAIERVHGMKTLVLPIQDLPADAYTQVKSPRYRADSLIRKLNREKPDSLYLILGLTHRDISTTKKDTKGNTLQPESKYLDWGVFGLGYLGKPGCVVSTYRIQNVTKVKLINRMQKICVHELGHNRSLPHCPNPHCVMQDAVERVQTVDDANLEFCEKCLSKLR